MVTVADRSKATLLPIIQRYISPGSLIMSDCWKAYARICELPENYGHMTVNHSENYVDPITGCCTNTIEGSWRHMKKSLPISIRSGQYASYLGEHLWRKMNRGNDLFIQLFVDISKVHKPKCYD
jgi:hypothetical protein